MLTADSSATSAGRRSPDAGQRAARVRSGRRTRAAASPRHTATRARLRPAAAGRQPSARRQPATATGTAPTAGSVKASASASIAGSASAPVGRPSRGLGEQGLRAAPCCPRLTPEAGASPRGPSPRLIVVCATFSRRPISASDTPWSRHPLACSHCAAVTFPGPAPACLPDQRRRPVPLRRVARRRATWLPVSPSTAATTGPGTPMQPQRRQRDVHHPDVPGRVLKQHHLPSRDHAPASVLAHAEGHGALACPPGWPKPPLTCHYPNKALIMTHRKPRIKRYATGLRLTYCRRSEPCRQVAQGPRYSSISAPCARKAQHQQCLHGNVGPDVDLRQLRLTWTQSHEEPQ